MLNDLPAGQQVYLITGYTDLRRSIDGLASVVQGQLNLDSFSTVLFPF
ncbi:MAG: IS66 family insertion sequence element accessory protein TnpB [Ruminococcus sp.]|nr:IS66 family insertion sequence element accessory protein TnpB [Ruminococcus sp.]